MPTPKACAFAVLTAFAAAALGVFGVEVATRMVLGPPATQFFTKEFHDVQTDFDVTYGVKADGTRVTCPVSGIPRRRVVVIGDSNAFGQGVRDGEDFVSRISCRLRDTEVTNLGIIGQDFVWYEIALRSLVRADTRDIVLVANDNDLPPADAESAEKKAKRFLYGSSHFVLMMRRAKYALSWWMHGSAIDSLTVAAKLNNPRIVAMTNPAYFHDVAHPSAERLALFDTTLRRFVSAAEKAAPNARIFVAVAPEAATVSMGHRSFYRSLANVPLPEFGKPSELYLRAARVCSSTPPCSFIDLFPALLKSGGEAYFPHDFHWNAHGHNVVTEVILSRIDVR